MLRGPAHKSPSASTLMELPGEPLESGFDYRPYEECTEIHLSPEAEKRLRDVLDSVDEALRKAQESAGQYVVG